MYGETFRFADCCMHDDDYDKGGDKYSRLFADKMFFDRIMRVIHKEDITPTRTLWMVFIAYAYYIAEKRQSNLRT